MSEIVVSGNNDNVVIDDKDTFNKTVNKTVNVTKSDNTQIENDIKVIQADIAKLQISSDKHTAALTRINKKINKLIIKLIPKDNKEEVTENEQSL